MVNLIITGSRDFTDEKYLRSMVNEWTRGCGIWSYPEDMVVICGDARGADKLGAEWAQCHGIAVTHMPAKWRKSTGLVDRGAGHKRNAEMAEIGDILFAFWDGKSTGTKSMIDVALKKGLEVHVYQIKD